MLEFTMNLQEYMHQICKYCKFHSRDISLFYREVIYLTDIKGIVS